MARRTSGRRTDYTWQGSQVTGGLAAAGISVTAVLTSAVSGTIMRSRGELLAVLDGPTAGDQAVVFAGLIVVTEEQLAVGATAIPNPGADFDADWMWHGGISLIDEGAFPDFVGGRLTIDSKAMRKIKQSMSVALVVANSSSVGTPAIDFEGYLRILFGA